MSATIRSLLSVVPGTGNSQATAQIDPTDEEEPEQPTGINAMDDSELRQHSIEARQRMERSGSKIEKIESKYYDILEQGAETTDQRRKVFAMKARILRLKGHFEEMKRSRALRDLMVYEFAKNHSEMEDMLDEELGDESLMDDAEFSIGEIQSQMSGAASKIQADLDSLNDSMGEMSAAVSMNSISTGKLPEEEHMDRIAEGNQDPESIDLDFDAKDDVDVDTIVGGAQISNIDF